MLKSTSSRILDSDLLRYQASIGCIASRMVSRVRGDLDISAFDREDYVAELRIKAWTSILRWRESPELQSRCTEESYVWKSLWRRASAIQSRRFLSKYQGVAVHRDDHDLDPVDGSFEDRMFARDMCRRIKKRVPAKSWEICEQYLLDGCVARRGGHRDRYAFKSVKTRAGKSMAEAFLSR